MDESYILLEEHQAKGDAEIIVSAGANQGYAVTIKDQLWVGRDPECGLQLFDEAVSSRHCRIHRREASFYIEDNRSRNGTFLNGRRVTSHLLYHRDEIGCGASTLKFLCPSCPNPKKTTVAAVPVQTQPPVEKIETPMEAEVIEAALLEESKLRSAGGMFAQRLITGYRLLQIIAHQTDWQEMFRRLVEHMPQLVPHHTVVLCRYNPRTQRAFPVVHRRPQEDQAERRILMDQDLIGRCCSERRSIAQRQADGRWILVAPMSGLDRILGVLYMESSDLPDPRLALALLAGVCRQAGMVLVQCDLVNAIRQQKLQLEEAARAVEREKSKIDALVEAISEGIVLASPAGAVLLANPGGRECLASLCRCDANARLESIAGAPWSELESACTPSTPGAIRELADPARGRKYEFSMFYVTLGGPEGGEGTGQWSHGFALLFRDVTELRAKEQALHQVQKLEAVGTLAGGLAHEFNNILATISTEAAAALEFREFEYARESLTNILEAAGAASTLTRELLNFAKPQDPVREPADLAAIVMRALNFTRPGLRNQRIEVVLNTDPLPPVVVDSRQLQQVFVNILTNARDAMTRGGTLTVTVAARDGGAQVCFTDTGIGIPPQDLHRIFDPFFTTKGPYGKSKIPGTGLGLSVALSIVRSHGGRITVNSEVGSGTTVAVWIPVQGAPLLSAPAGPAAPAAPATPAASGATPPPATAEGGRTKG